MKHLLKLVGLASLLVIALAACPQPTLQPQIVSFTATPSNLSAATSVKLEWVVQNASSLSISPNVGLVTGSSTTINVTNSTSFELTAQNSSGTAKKTVLVTLQSPLFDPTSAWQAPIPTTAQQITPEEYQQKVEAGELLPINNSTRASQENTAEQQYQNDLTILRGLQNPTLQELLNAPNNPNPEIRLSDNKKVLLLDQRNAAKSAVQQIQASQDVANALSLYSSLFAYLPEALQTQVQAPASLQAQPLGTVQAALAALNVLLDQEATLGDVQLETNFATNTTAPLRPQAIVAGNGADNNLGSPNCRTPSGLVAQFRFPLKKFISPIKDQAKRGLCWAFSAIGAIESRERVQNGIALDLSEQFLAYKVKSQWSRADFGDGFGSESALSFAAARLQPIPNEAYWTYNPARGRQDVAGDAFASFANSCDWMPGGAKEYTGTCSDSAHQAQAVCTKLSIAGFPEPIPFCAIQLDPDPVVGTFASPSKTTWKTGDPFNLSSYQLLLAKGHTLIATFPVYKGFMTIGSSGYLTDKRRLHDEPDPKDPTKNIEVAGPGGSHVVQIVGFIKNEALTPPGNVAGGGYFIVKNSWGCDFGDGGYAYIDAQYVEDVFMSLSYLDFSSQRSAAWTSEQNALQAAAPTITAKTAPRAIDLRVTTNLSSLFSLGHENPLVNQVNLTVQLGNTTLYNATAQTKALLPLELPYTFSSTGLKTLRVTARYGTQSTTQDIDFEVLNTAPKGDLRVTATPIYLYSSQVGAATVNVSLTDPNESDPNNLCPQIQWEVQAPDFIEGDPNTGCSQQIRFGISGYRNVFVYITDSDGLRVKTGGAFLVENPPVNPNPVVTSAGIVPVERLIAGNCSIGRVLSNGATLQLDSLAYGTNCAGNPNTTRYSATAQADNPDGEQLEYNWLLKISGFTAASGTTFNAAISSSSVFGFGYVTYGLGGTLPCQLDLYITPVNAASRAKFRTVWTGHCKVAAVVPR